MEYTQASIKNLLRNYGIRPSKAKGQNFLVDKTVISKILQVADLKKDDYVLEIGPGFGILTEQLIKNCKKVLAVELDKHLSFYLKKKFKGIKNLELLTADILKIKNEQIVKLLKPGSTNYKVVANLPYAITKPVLKKFLSYEPKPLEMVILLQKEVAEKIAAAKGKMSILALSVLFYGQPEIIDFVAKQSFYPQPEVDSAILKITLPKAKLPAQIQEILGAKTVGFEEKKFWQLIKVGFSSPRKQLQNNLAAGFKLDKDEVKKQLELAGFPLAIRPENLSLKDWAKLYLKFIG